MGNRAGEAATLNNMAVVYRATGEPGKALALYEQALPIMRQVGHRAGEAITCFNLAMLYRDRREFEQAVEYLRNAVQLKGQVQHPDYQQDTALLAEWEKSLREGKPLPKEKRSARISSQEVRTFVVNTIAAMTINTDKWEEWREVLQRALKQAQEQDDKDEFELFTALIALLDGSEVSVLADEHPYNEALEAVIEGIEDGGTGLQRAAQEAEAVMAAIRTYLDAEDIQTLRQVIEEHQETLFSAEVEALFQANIKQSRRERNQEAEQLLAFHLELLKSCKQEGIEAAFNQLSEKKESSFRKSDHN